MGVARQSLKNQKKVKPREVDVTGMRIFKASDPQKHFNFRPRGKDNIKGGIYYNG